MTTTYQPDEAVLRSVLPEDIDWVSLGYVPFALTRRGSADISSLPKKA
jgi:hypothetical protein